jgi:hypothetical protein
MSVNERSVQFERELQLARAREASAGLTDALRTLSNIADASRDNTRLERAHIEAQNVGQSVAGIKLTT